MYVCMYVRTYVRIGARVRTRVRTGTIHLEEGCCDVVVCNARKNNHLVNLLVCTPVPRFSNAPQLVAQASHCRGKAARTEPHLTFASGLRSCENTCDEASTIVERQDNKVIDQTLSTLASEMRWFTSTTVPLAVGTDGLLLRAHAASGCVCD